MTKRTPKNVNRSAVNSIVESAGMEQALVGSAVLADVRVATQDQPLEALELLAQQSGSGVTRVELPQGQADFLAFVREWTAKHKRPVGMGLSTLLILPLAACGGGGGGVLQPTTSSGYVIDGAISGATVTRTNGSQTGAVVTTDGKGHFAGLTGTGDMKSVGGTDILSGHHFINTLTAPDGAIISPLTTLVQRLMSVDGGGKTQAQALALVQGAFGLTGKNILTLDPTTDLAVYKAGQVVANAMTAAGGGTNGTTAMNSLAAIITAKALSTPGTPLVDLTSVVQLAAITGIDSGTATVLAAQNSNVTGQATLLQASLLQTDISGTATDVIAYMSHLATGSQDAIGKITIIGSTSLANAMTIAGYNNVGDFNVTLNETVTATQANTLALPHTGVITATLTTDTLANIKAALTDSDVNAYAITLSNAGSVAAADLLALDAKTSVAINAASVTDVTGSYVDVTAAYSSAGITGLGNETVTVTDASVTVVQANVVAAATTGVVTATIAEHDMVTLANLTDNTPVNGNASSGGNAFYITVTDATVNAGALNTLDGKTTVNVVATAVTLLVGTAHDVAIAISAATIDTARNVGVTLDAGTAAASDLNTIDANTVALADGTYLTRITGSDVDTARAITSRGFNLPVDVPVTLTNTTVDSANVLVIDYNTSGLIDASSVTTVRGSYTDVAAVYASVEITGLNNEAVALSGTVAVGQANDIAAVTSGVVTATIVNNDMATLANLTETGNAYSITVGDASVAAADLTALYGKTT
ncbi:MAG: hypothetical protein HQ445_02980, partial [Polaromonas sp.]|nr:hypothetical protein [Polaromonas sp.]